MTAVVEHHRVEPGAALRPHTTIDRAGATRAVRELLVALGADPEHEELRDTPRRVAAALEELLERRPFSFTTFANEQGYDELVLVRDISFHSLCRHHLLPFSGVAHVAYLPAERIVGLSKLARAVEFIARGLQVQEQLTSEVADLLERRLAPNGVGVVLEAEHSCMSVRGVRRPGAVTVTSAVRGLLRDDARTRAEFFALARPGAKA